MMERLQPAAWGCSIGHDADQSPMKNHLEMNHVRLPSNGNKL